MSHRVSVVIRLEHVGFAPEDIQQGSLAGNVPIGTYELWMSVTKKSSINALHPVCSFCQDTNYKLLVHRGPSPHPSVCVYNRLDVVLNVFFLSALVV